MLDLRETELALHNDARELDRVGDPDGADLLRHAADLVAEARRVDVPRQRVIDLCGRVTAILR